MTRPGHVATEKRRVLRSTHARTLSTMDKLVVVLMVTIPAIIVTGLVWVPAVSTVVLSFTDWNGIGDLGDIKFVGTENYDNVINNYPPLAADLLA